MSARKTTLFAAVVCLPLLAGAAAVGREADATDGPFTLAPAAEADEAEAPILLTEPEAAFDLPPPPAAAADAPVPRSLLADDGVSTAEIVPVSPQAADGMLLDEFSLDEMPWEASSGRWFWSGGWYAGVESLWMDRSRNNAKIIVQDINRTGPITRVVNYYTLGQPFDVSGGARVTLGRSLGRDDLDRDRSLEFIFYGGLTWDDNDGWNALQDGKLVTPLNYQAPGFNGGNRYTTSLTSDFNSFELNYKLRRRLGRDQLVMSPGGDWTRQAERGFLPGLIVGVRLAHVNEFWNMRSSIINPAPVPPAEFGGNYDITATNWLLGLSFGSELISQNEFFYWGLRGRAAPAISFASTHQHATGVNNGTGITPTGSIDIIESGNQTGAGFLGDLTLLIGWNVTPNFALQAGYDFLWVGGMATATRQFNLDNQQFNDIDAGGQTFYQGLSFGFYGSW